MSKPVFKSTDIQRLRSRFTDEAFSEMKSKFPDEKDESLARFLIARDGDVSKAAPFLQESIQWRAKNLPVKIGSFDVEYKKGKIFIDGADKFGHPLLHYRGCLNFAKDRDMDEMLNLSLYWMETAIQSLPDDKTQLTLLFDRTGSSKENVDIDYIKALAAIMQNNYPERLHKIIVHPVGILFYAGWQIAKFFIDKATQEKVHPVLYLIGVQEYVADEKIPIRMGGESAYIFTAEELGDPSTSIKPEIIPAALDTKEILIMALQSNEVDGTSDVEIQVEEDTNIVIESKDESEQPTI